MVENSPLSIDLWCCPTQPLQGFIEVYLSLWQIAPRAFDCGDEIVAIHPEQEAGFELELWSTHMEYTCAPLHISMLRTLQASSNQLVFFVHRERCRQVRCTSSQPGTNHAPVVCFGCHPGLLALVENLQPEINPRVQA